MNGYVNNFDYTNITTQKYWSFPSNYTKEKKHEMLNLMLYSGDYVASEKKDGYWEMFIKDDEGDLLMRARTKGVNGWIFKQDWVPHLKPFFDKIPNGTVLIGEVYIPDKTSKAVTSVLGCKVEKAVERQTGANRLHLSVFDILAWNGMNVHSHPITMRIDYLEKVATMATEEEYVDVVEYWDEPETIHENWLRILSEGGEGVVLTKKTSPYDFGKRTARATLKLKKELEETVDVFLTGKWKSPTKEYTGTELETWRYWIDEETGERFEGTIDTKIHLNGLTPVTRLYFYDWAGAVEIATILNGKPTPIGYISGISDEVRKGIIEENSYWKGKVVELQAMEIAYNDDIPALRHAKIVNWRNDKDWRDCQWI